MEKEIEYTAPSGNHGRLYNLHFDDWTGKYTYSMSVRNKDGYEVLHAYNAAPRTLKELKNVVDNELGTYFFRQMAKKAD